MRCPKCRRDETETDFYASQSYCKPCWNAYESARRKALLAAETPEQREARLAARRLKRHGRPERVNVPIQDEADAARRKGARAKRYYQEHRVARIAYQTARRNADPEAARAYERQVYQRRKAKARASNRAREARMEKPDADTLAYMEVLRRDPCAYCGGPAGQVDHVEPVVAGGRNHWDNLTAACRPCNRRKWSRPLLLSMLEARR